MGLGTDGALIEGFSPEIPLLVTTRTVLATGSGRTRLCRILSSVEPGGPLSYLYLDSAKPLASRAGKPSRDGQSRANDELSERIPSLHISERLPRLIQRILVTDDRIECAIGSEADERLEVRLGSHRAADDVLVTEE